MAAVANGLSLHGALHPYIATFLIFSDYMKPAVRLSALSQCPVTFIFTHDSIGLGEDGPTHQPIEQLDALRAMPGLTVFRPADGIETAMAWAWIAEKAPGPGMLALTRQKVPALDRPAGFAPEDVWRGGYPVIETEGAPAVVLVATGSEVGLACAAAGKLRAEGHAARVVSLPCPELFLAQPAAYQRGLIPEDGTPVVAIEAGRAESLRRFTGSRGLVCGIDRFGASAPIADLAEKFGLTPESLARRVRDHLDGLSSGA